MKKLLCLVLAVMLAMASISAFAEVYKDKATVKAVQQALNDAGYECGKPDGSAGKKTKAAISQYQTDHGMEPTGEIDDALLISLGLMEGPAEEVSLTADEAAAALTGGTWYYNGGSDTTVNRIVFGEGDVAVTSFTIDGNRQHDQGTVNGTWTVADGEPAHIALEDGTEFDIPFFKSGDNILLGDHVYFNEEQVIAGLQGYWKAQSSDKKFNGETYYTILKLIHIQGDSMESESFSLSYIDPNGDFLYYYYGPYTGSYTLNFPGFDTDMSHGIDWFFNIIDGEVTLLNYDHVCTRAEGLIGEDDIEGEDFQ